MADCVPLAGAAVRSGQTRVHGLSVGSVCICGRRTVKALAKQTLSERKNKEAGELLSAAGCKGNGTRDTDAGKQRPTVFDNSRASDDATWWNQS